MSRARRREALALATAVVCAVLGGGAARATGAPAAVRMRSAVDLGTALVLAGSRLPVGDVESQAQRAAMTALGRRRAGGLVRVVALPELRAGATGNVVALAQARLEGLGNTLAVDGDFGPVTRAAVMAFQRSVSLPANGVVDAATWRALLGLRVPVAGTSVWALAAAYDTSPAALSAWNAGIGDLPADWTRPLHGTVWVMPPDVRPSRRLEGSGVLPATGAPSTTGTAPTRSTGAGSPLAGGKAGTAKTSATGTPPAGAPASGRAPAAPGAVLVALDVVAPAPAAALERLAAYLGGRAARLTVFLPPAALSGRGAAALTLEGEDVGVAMPQRARATRIGAALAAQASDTGSRSVVGWAGAYPSAATAALAARLGLALVVGQPVATAATATVGDLVVLTGTPQALLRQLPAALATLARRGDTPSAVGPGLRLAP